MFDTVLYKMNVFIILINGGTGTINCTVVMGCMTISV